MLYRIELVESAVEELNTVIATACRPWSHMELFRTIPGVEEKDA